MVDITSGHGLPARPPTDRTSCEGGAARDRSRRDVDQIAISGGIATLEDIAEAP
jgi:hypothetical protein